jgi:hypothetical protein
MDVELRRGDTRAIVSPDGSVSVRMRNRPRQHQQGHEHRNERQRDPAAGLALEQELRLIEDELERRRPFVVPSESNDSLLSSHSEVPSPVHLHRVDTAWSVSPRKYLFRACVQQA